MNLQNIIGNDFNLPSDMDTYVRKLELAYENGVKDMTYKLQCCANCKDNSFGHKCSKAQTGECVDYSCWRIHDYDGVSM